MVTVGISDLKVVTSPEILVTYALGSCVGICLYDGAARLAGLSHIMLPTADTAAAAQQPMRYADTGIALLVRQMEAQGASRLRMKAKIAGGAQMFAAVGNSSISNIGQRNVVAVKAILQGLRIPIVADDTGADFGRTVYFDADTGTMRVKSATKGEWSL